MGAQHVWGSTLVTVVDDATGLLASGVTNLRFDFYAVADVSGTYKDPFDGVNPFTGVDDGLTAAFVSPQLLEIDVLAAVPEPSTAALLGLGLVLGLARGRRTR